MGFSRQEYWSGLPCPSPGDLPDSRIKLTSLKSPALAGGFFTTSATWEAHSWEMSFKREKHACPYRTYTVVCGSRDNKETISTSKLWFFQWSCMGVTVGQ